MFSFKISEFGERDFQTHNESKYHNLIYSKCVNESHIKCGRTNYDKEKTYLSYIKKEIKENDDILPGDVILLSYEYNYYLKLKHWSHHHGTNMFYAWLVILDTKGEKSYMKVNNVASSKCKFLAPLLSILLKHNNNFFGGLRNIEHDDGFVCFNLQDDASKVVKKYEKKLMESSVETPVYVEQNEKEEKIKLPNMFIKFKKYDSFLKIFKHSDEIKNLIKNSSIDKSKNEYSIKLPRTSIKLKRLKRLSKDDKIKVIEYLNKDILESK